MPRGAGQEEVGFTQTRSIACSTAGSGVKLLEMFYSATLHSGTRDSAG